MRRKFTFLILSLFLIGSSVNVFADGHNDNRGGKGRQEQGTRQSGRNNSGNRVNGSHNNNRPGKGNDKKTKDNKGHQMDKGHKPGNGNHGNMRPGDSKPGGDSFRPGHGSTPPPPPAPAPAMRPGYGASFHPGPALPPPPPRLPYMVRNLTRGCRDVAVWQVNPETFAVRYRLGGRLYVQYVYPYANLYGEANVISVNWQPQSLWTLIPPIQLNINL